jgi:hypothetical protein
MPIKEELQRYQNTLFFSMSNETENDEIDNDLLLEGDLARLGAGIAQQMMRHPELVEFFEYALNKYDALVFIMDQESKSPE